eukprot:7794341-Lingulodinium_polyedra.AAC.1
MAPPRMTCARAAAHLGCRTAPAGDGACGGAAAAAHPEPAGRPQSCERWPAGVGELRLGLSPHALQPRPR